MQINGLSLFEIGHCCAQRLRHLRYVFLVSLSLFGLEHRLEDHFLAQRKACAAGPNAYILLFIHYQDTAI